MDSKVAAYTATPDPTFGRKSKGHSPERGEDPFEDAPARAFEEADLRLVIEEDPASGSLVYRTVNRRTGEVVSELPREEVLKLREQADYVAGGVVRTKA